MAAPTLRSGGSQDIVLELLQGRQHLRALHLGELDPEVRLGNVLVFTDAGSYVSSLLMSGTTLDLKSMRSPPSHRPDLARSGMKTPSRVDFYKRESCRGGSASKSLL